MSLRLAVLGDRLLESMVLGSQVGPTATEANAMIGPMRSSSRHLPTAARSTVSSTALIAAC